MSAKSEQSERSPMGRPARAWSPPDGAGSAPVVSPAPIKDSRTPIARPASFPVPPGGARKEQITLGIGRICRDRTLGKGGDRMPEKSCPPAAAASSKARAARCQRTAICGSIAAARRKRSAESSSATRRSAGDAVFCARWRATSPSATQTRAPSGTPRQCTLEPDLARLEITRRKHPIGPPVGHIRMRPEECQADAGEEEERHPEPRPPRHRARAGFALLDRGRRRDAEGKPEDQGGGERRRRLVEIEIDHRMQEKRRPTDQEAPVNEPSRSRP